MFEGAIAYLKLLYMIGTTDVSAQGLEKNRKAGISTLHENRLVEENDYKSANFSSGRSGNILE